MPLGGPPAAGGGGGPVPGDTERQTFVPAIDTSDANFDIGSGTNLLEGDYSVDSAGEVSFNIYIEMGAGVDPGTGLFQVDPPVPANLANLDIGSGGATSRKIGGCTLVRNDGFGSVLPGTHLVGSVHISAAGKIVFVPEAAGQIDTAYVSATAPWSWAEGDAIHAEGTYPQA